MLCSAMTIAHSIARSIARSSARSVAVAALVAGSLAACSPPSAPDEERRPEPHADTSLQSGIVQAADAYKDRARAAGAQQEDAAKRQQAELDAATQ